ncbi:hypothetical protein JKF63_07555 [Porcisia hertigi]|uniref:Uncharacterized protein n=1 Tax=Porcisia hertigi TaxID=2761500 RepID=A0A836LM91_9TRYP|nr:hypothetical protein JKF63_07555 [Porcisia hertigi]
MKQYGAITLSTHWSCACGYRVQQGALKAPYRWRLLLQPTWTARSYATASRVSRRSLNNKSMYGNGLWGAHSLHSPLPSSLMPSQLTPFAAHGEGSTPPVAPPPRSDTVRGLSSSSSLIFTLDPPFTPVEGEVELSPGPCVYVCRLCQAVVFHSNGFSSSSRVGQHNSGWPTFVAPSKPSALRLSTVLQKRIVARLGDVTRSEAIKDISAGSSTSQQALDIAVPPNSVAQRGLAVEGDLVRRRGTHISAQVTRTWREACLRDGNHRVDPVLVLGLCCSCGTPVCNFTHSAVLGTQYVSTAACIVAKAEDAVQPGSHCASDT